MFKARGVFFVIVGAAMLLTFFILESDIGFRKKTAKEISLREVSKYLKEIKKQKNKKRTEARNPAQSTEEGVSVRLPGFKTIRIENLKYIFQDEAKLSGQDLNALSDFINKKFIDEKIKDLKTSLEFVNQFSVDDKMYVRFQQVIERRFQSEKYKVPIKGSQVLAVIKKGELVRLNSSFVKFNFSDAIFYKSGIDFDFSDREFSKFVGAIKTNKFSRRLLRKYLNGMLKGKKGSFFDFDVLLNREVSEQRRQLNQAFNRVGRLGLQKIFLELARAKRLSLVRYGRVWMFQVNNFFELPIQFDIMMTSATDKFLKIKNLREIYHKVAAVRGFESPYYPGGKKEENTESALRAKNKLKKIISYIDERFKWGSYKGKDSNDEVGVHTQLKSIDFRENAAWIGSVQKILVGEDGESLEGLDSSISILGHEYTHAIVEFSSGLIYKGESGAINEHFADSMGATIEADVDFDGEFQYTIGEDILIEETREQKKNLLALVFKGSEYTEEQKKAFRLRSVGMRHLYAPELSYTTQYEHMSEVSEIYPLNCEPSYDNDNCGVHMSSGVLNRAMALVVSIEGTQKILPLVFNTVVFRIGESATFKDYLFELHEECIETYGADETCNIILASFSRVGVEHPDFPVEAFLGSADTEVVVEEIPITGNATSPTLKFCGWVEEMDPQNYRIFDDKFNALAISRNFSVKTEGDYSALKDLDCACVKGRVTQKTNFNNETQNIFLNVVEIEDRKGKCAEDPRIKDMRPDSDLRFQSVLGSGFKKSMTFCGWVSVNSKSKNVTVIDNRFDAAILASDTSKVGYVLTSGEKIYSEIYKHECACVKGELRDEVNSKGTVFNAFARVEGVWKRPPEACIGIEWR